MIGKKSGGRATQRLNGYDATDMDEQPLRARLPEISGIAVSIVTGFAYAMAFAFEAGNAGAFGVPFEMVDMQLMPAIFGMLVALSIFWSASQAFDPLIPVITRRPDDPPLLATVKPYLQMLTLGLVFWLVLQPVPWWQIFTVVGCVVLLLAMDLLLPLMDTNTEGYAEKVRRYQQRPSGWKYPLRDAMRAYPNYYRITFFLILAILLSAAAGYGRGRRQRDFFVTNLTPETVVLRIYGNRVIAAEFVRNEKRIKPVYKFLRLDEPGLTLQLERVGPINFTEGQD